MSAIISILSSICGPVFDFASKNFPTIAAFLLGKKIAEEKIENSELKTVNNILVKQSEASLASPKTEEQLFETLDKGGM